MLPGRKIKSGRILIAKQQALLILLIVTGLFAVTPVFPKPSSAQPPSLPTPDRLDLDVTYIERTPRDSVYKVNYPNGIPILAPSLNDLDQNPNNDKRWPDAGETVTLTAHIINKGGINTGPFTYKWYLDENEVKTGTHQNLASYEEGTESFEWKWPVDLNDHAIKFVADPNGVISEVSKINNQLTEYTNSLAYSIWVERGFYDIFNQQKNGQGTYSFEDWIQWQFSSLKDDFLKAVYPTTPEGIKERIRIDKIVVAEELDGDSSPMRTDPDLYLIDGRWQFSDGDYLNNNGRNGNWQNYADNYLQKIDAGLLHELVHQLGIIDNYRFGNPDPPGQHVKVLVKDKNGNYVDPPAVHICPGLMGGDSISPHCEEGGIEDHVAAALNANLHQRRGFYGDYLFDIPLENYFRVLDRKGNPMSGVNVALYQKAKGTEAVDNIPEHQGTTDQNGRFFLENKPVDSVTTVTGHTLRNNPFGQISVVGENGTFLIKISTNQNEEFQWITLRPFNLVYWAGNRDQAFYDIKTNLESICPWDIIKTGASNGKVDAADLAEINRCYSPLGSPGAGCQTADLNSNGVVNALDYSILLTHWGNCP